MQYVYTQPAHSQATVQPQYAYIQPPQITQPTSKHPQVYLASSSHTPTQGQSWYSDSGVSHHVTNMSQNIQQVTPFEGLDQITIGNGQGLNINSSSVSSFSSPLNCRFSLVLRLFVPSITKNLICVSQFYKDNNVFFEFHSSFCLVKSQDYKHVLLKGGEGLY